MSSHSEPTAKALYQGDGHSVSAQVSTSDRNGRTPHIHAERIDHSEDGAILILALVFILIVTVSVFGLITFGGVGIKNAVNLKGERSLEYAAAGATEAAIQAVRYSDLSFSYPPVDCLPDGAVLSTTPPDTVTMTINNLTMVVDCATTVWPSSYQPRPQDRIVALYACLQSSLVGSTPCGSGNAIISATVDFQDVSSGGIYDCSSATGTATCGTGVAILSWVVQNADS
jgi:hypothetical protein